MRSTRPARVFVSSAKRGLAPYRSAAIDVCRRLGMVAVGMEVAVSDDPVMVVEAIGDTGKSALTWQWATTRATSSIEGLAGRMW